MTPWDELRRRHIRDHYGSRDLIQGLDKVGTSHRTAIMITKLQHNDYGKLSSVSIWSLHKIYNKDAKPPQIIHQAGYQIQPPTLEHTDFVTKILAFGGWGKSIRRA